MNAPPDTLRWELTGPIRSEAALMDFFAELAARARAAAGPTLRVELVICIGRGTPEKLARQVPRITALRLHNRHMCRPVDAILSTADRRGRAAGR